MEKKSLTSFLSMVSVLARICLSRFRIQFKKIEKAGLVSLYKSSSLAYVLSLCNSSADTVNQNGKPLLCCFVKSLLER